MPANRGGGRWMPVFFVCAGLLGLLAVSLTVSVGRLRMQKKIYLGDGGDPEMLAAIRAHGNFMEYVPLCLVLIYVVSDFYTFWYVAALSLVLLLSRVLHAGGLLGFIPLGRTLGASGTTLILAITSAMLIISGINLKQY
ncbi:MAG: hypothetical protein GEV13_01245 [Rhodospirillales bacterium]|nr:hypothetical protein [Rhodospirillales bacterium]